MLRCLRSKWKKRKRKQNNKIMNTITCGNGSVQCKEEKKKNAATNQRCGVVTSCAMCRVPCARWTNKYKIYYYATSRFEKYVLTYLIFITFLLRRYNYAVDGRWHFFVFFFVFAYLFIYTKRKIKVSTRNEAAQLRPFDSILCRIWMNAKYFH